MNTFSYIVFNHIPKCGGSSLREMFYNACLSHELFSKCQLFISSYTHENICLQEHREAIYVLHKQTKVFFDHSHAYFFEDTFNLDISKTFRIINIRNPIHRFISHMYFFDRISPEQCSYKVLKQKVKQYGLVYIDYLTLQKYNQQKLDLETRLNIAKEELEKYSFVFILEKFRDCVEQFNITNPFELRLEEKHINESNGKNLKLSKRTLYNIKKLIEPDIILLKDFYPNIDEDINQY